MSGGKGFLYNHPRHKPSSSYGDPNVESFGTFGLFGTFELFGIFTPIKLASLNKLNYYCTSFFIYIPLYPLGLLILNILLL